MFNEYNFSELERRIATIEKAIEKSNFCYFLEQRDGKSQEKKQDFDFEFISHAKTYLKITSNVKLKQEYTFTVKAFLNEAFIDEWQFNSEKATIEFLLPVNKGLNKISLMCESESAIDIKSCTLETFGNIGYKQDDYQLLHIIEEDNTLILFYENGRATLKNYKDGNFTFIKEWKNLKSITICKINGNYLIAYVNQESKGIVEIYDGNFTLTENCELDNALSSICSISGTQATLFAVKGNAIYKYLFTNCENFEKTKTNFTGKRVQSNPQVSECIIITDFNGFAKLVTI